MVNALILLILLVFSVQVEASTVYKWVDRNGVANFTDDRDKVPSLYRGTMGKEIVEDSSGAKVPPVRGIASPGKERARSDLSMMDETWWTDKARPWKEQLEDATARYEKIQEKFARKEDLLVRHRFEGKNRFVMNSIELDGLKKQMEEQEARIAEAEQMLGKLTKEAEESRANPAWLGPEMAAPRRIASSQKDEIKEDLYGRDETWWREKVRPWKERLNEATENYEEAQKRFLMEGEGLGPVRFGGLSLTQYQMISVKLTALDEKLEKHRVEIAEANEMLKKLSKEAEESKANPEWLK